MPILIDCLWDHLCNSAFMLQGTNNPRHPADPAIRFHAIRRFFVDGFIVIVCACIGRMQLLINSLNLYRRISSHMAVMLTSASELADDLNIFRQFELHAPLAESTAELEICRRRVHKWGTINRVSFDAGKDFLSCRLASTR